MDDGISIFAGEVLAEVGKARLSSANSFARRQRIQPLFVLVTVVKRPDSPPGSNLSSAPDFGFDRSLFRLRHLFVNSFFISVCRDYTPFQTAVLSSFLLEPPV